MIVYAIIDEILNLQKTFINCSTDAFVYKGEVIDTSQVNCPDNLKSTLAKVT